MEHLSMYSYSWDFDENDVTNTVNEWKRIDINTVNLASTYHAGKFLRPKSKKSDIRIPEDGTAYFKSDVSKYGSIKPKAHSIFGNGEILSELTEARTYQ